MIRKKVITMFLVFVMCTGLVVVLFLKATPGDVATNGFVRRFRDVRVLSPVDTLDLNYNSFYIAGKGRTHLYLGNIVSPQHLLAVDIACLDSERVKLQLPEAIKKGYWSINVRVDSPNYYLADGAVPFIYRGRLDDKLSNRLLEDGIYFLDFLPLDSNAFAVRTISRAREGRLGKLSLNPFHLNYPSGLLERQLDGLLCTDGMLHYDRWSRRLVYLYRYRNQFLVMDSDLNLRYKGTTIDTNTVAKIGVATVASTNSVTFSRPPLVVNKESCMDAQRLYVLSSLLADNDEMHEAGSASVVDVYDLQACQYAFSFYIPDYDGRKVTHFQAFEKRLIAQYSDKIVSFTLIL